MAVKKDFLKHCSIIWAIFTRFWQNRHSSTTKWLFVLEEKTTPVWIPFEISDWKLGQRITHTVSTWRCPHVQVRASSTKNKPWARGIPSRCSNGIFLDQDGSKLKTVYIPYPDSSRHTIVAGTNIPTVFAPWHKTYSKEVSWSTFHNKFNKITLLEH